MDHFYEQFDLIEEITRNDGSQYYEISNIDQTASRNWRSTTV